MLFVEEISGSSYAIMPMAMHAVFTTFIMSYGKSRWGTMMILLFPIDYGK